MNSLENRIPPPVLLLFVAIVMFITEWIFGPISIEPIMRYSVIFVFFLVALLLGPFAILAFRRNQTTIDPVHIERASKLVISGPFRYSRNPMYTSMVALLIAWAFYLANPWAALGPILFAFYIWRFQIIPEERAMRTKFGTDYQNYSRAVRRWI